MPMTDLQLDPHRCPDCGGAVGDEARCPSCGLALRGPLATQLWQVSAEIVRLQGVRARLIAALRPARPDAAAPPAPSAAAPAPVKPAVAYPPWQPPAPRKEWTPQRVQNLLLIVGALLLVAASVTFTVLAWGRLGIGGRAAVMVGVTAVTGWSARWVDRRGLTASAEVIALLTVLFAAVDAYAARRTNLAGLAGTDAATFWTVASPLLAAGAAGFARLVPARSLRAAALAGVQAPLLITAVRLHDVTLAQRGAFLVAQAAALAYGARYLRGLAVFAYASAAASWLAGSALALTTAYEASGRVDVRVAAGVLVLAGAAALLAPGDRVYPAGVATLAFVLAALAPARLGLSGTQVPAAIAATGLLAVVAAANLPRSWRVGPLAVGGGTVAVAVAAVSPYVVSAVVLPFSWAATPWRLVADTPARLALSDGERWGGSVVVLAVVAVATVVVVVGFEALGRRREALWWTVAFASLAVVLAPLGFGWSYRGALAWDLAAGLAGLALAVVLRRWVVAVPATVALAVATAWSLADRDATLVVLLVVTLAYAAYAAADDAVRDAAAGVAASSAAAYVVAVSAARGAPVDRIGFVLATAAFSLVLAGTLLRGRVGSVVESVAGAAYVVGAALALGDPGWLAWTLGGGALCAGLSCVRPERRRLAAPAAALAIACAGVSATSFGAPPERAAFFVALCAAAVVGAGYLLRRNGGDVLEAVGGAGFFVALSLALPDPGWLSWVLAVAGLTALADALRPERRGLHWLAIVLLTAWSWDRLWIENVRVPEAYAAPVAVLALVLGHLRRRRDESVGSWSAYGTGLVAAFGSTLWLLVFEDPGVTRPVLVAIGGVVVLFAGMRERLQAPLTVGAVVLVVDALAQLAPVAASLPKWATIGAVGLAVIAVGVTYEDRRRDVIRLRESFESLN
jgi:hypothetical protein